MSDGCLHVHPYICRKKFWCPFLKCTVRYESHLVTISAKRFQKSPAKCPAFFRHFLPSMLCVPAPCVEYTEQWYDSASPEDMHHVTCLRVPSSFYDQLPPGYGPHFREHVAHHQYMMLHIVYQLKKDHAP